MLQHFGRYVSERVSTPCPGNVHPLCSPYQSLTHVRALEPRRFCNVSPSDRRCFASKCSKAGFHSRSSSDQRPLSLAFVSASSLRSSVSPTPRVHQRLGALHRGSDFHPTMMIAQSRARAAALPPPGPFDGFALGDVECPRAQFESGFEDGQAVALRAATSWFPSVTTVNRGSIQSIAPAECDSGRRGLRHRRAGPACRRTRGRSAHSSVRKHPWTSSTTESCSVAFRGTRLTGYEFACVSKTCRSRCSGPDAPSTGVQGLPASSAVWWPLAGAASGPAPAPDARHLVSFGAVNRLTSESASLGEFGSTRLAGLSPRCWVPVAVVAQHVEGQRRSSSRLTESRASRQRVQSALGRPSLSLVKCTRNQLINDIRDLSDAGIWCMSLTDSLELSRPQADASVGSRFGAARVHRHVRSRHTTQGIYCFLCGDRHPQSTDTVSGQAHGRGAVVRVQRISTGGEIAPETGRERTSAPH